MRVVKDQNLSAEILIHRRTEPSASLFDKDQETSPRSGDKGKLHAWRSIAVAYSDASALASSPEERWGWLGDVATRRDSRRRQGLRGSRGVAVQGQLLQAGPPAEERGFPDRFI